MNGVKQIEFPSWPTWNFQFPEPDVHLVHRVLYRPRAEEGTAAEPRELPADQWRLAIGRNGVSALVLLHRGALPELAERSDAVMVIYEPLTPPEALR